MGKKRNLVFFRNRGHDEDVIHNVSPCFGGTPARGGVGDGAVVVVDVVGIARRAAAVFAAAVCVGRRVRPPARRRRRAALPPEAGR